MAKSNFAQTEENHGLAKGQLKAIIYFSDRTWSDTKLYSKSRMVGLNVRQKLILEQKFEQMGEEKLPQVIPADEGDLVEATDYGLESGKVLLVSGVPPAAN